MRVVGSLKGERYTFVSAMVAAGAATLALGTSVASASAAKAPTCSTVGSALVGLELGATAQTPSTGSPSKIGGLTYLTCSYGATVTISYISPATGTGYSTLMAMLKKATVVATVPGLGGGAFSGTGSNTSSVYANGKTTMKTTTTENLWVLVTGKTIFEISVAKGNLSREKALAKRMVSLV